MELPIINIKEAQKRLKELQVEANQLHAIVDESKRNKILKCYSCKKGKKVKNLTFVQTHFYVSPYSCTGGDYWNPGPVGFTCPICLKFNSSRLSYEGKWSRPEINNLQKFFKNREDTY